MEAEGKRAGFEIPTNENVNMYIYRRFFLEHQREKKKSTTIGEELTIQNVENLQQHRDAHCYNPSMEPLDYAGHVCKIVLT